MTEERFNRHRAPWMLVLGILLLVVAPVSGTDNPCAPKPPPAPVTGATGSDPTDGSAVTVGGSGNGYDYTSLEDAIDKVPAGSTLWICEDLTVGQVTIDKSLTLKGHDNPTLSASADTCSDHTDCQGWFTVKLRQSGLEVSDLTFNGNGKNIYAGILHKSGSSKFYDVTFRHIAYQESGPDYQGTGIIVVGSGSWIGVDGGSFSDMGRAGLLFYGAGVTGTVDGIKYTGKGPGDWLDYGVDIGAGAVVTVENSTIQDCRGKADGSSSAGILVSTFNGSGTAATLTGNTIEHNSIGVAAGYGGGSKTDTSTVVAQRNTLTDNTIGLQAETKIPVKATGNTWNCLSSSKCPNITGPYADQVEYLTASWRFSGGISTTANPATGSPVMAMVAFDPPPSSGSVTFSSNGATLSTTGSVDLVDGAAGVTFTTPTAGTQFDITTTLGATTTTSPSLTAQPAPDPTNWMTLSPCQEGSSSACKTSYSAVTLDVFGISNGDSVVVVASDQEGYLSDATTNNCAIALAGPAASGTPSNTQITGDSDNYGIGTVQVSSDLAGREIYLQAVNSSQNCAVSAVVSFQLPSCSNPAGC